MHLQSSISGDLFELAGGKMAEKKSHNGAVMRLAKTLASDNTW
jgi:hypothetical protein